MKNFLVIALFSAMILSATENIALPKPAIPQEASLAAALANRQSHREFGGGELTPQQLSNLLWAAYGQNRADGNINAAGEQHKGLPDGKNGKNCVVLQHSRKRGELIHRGG